MDKIIRQSTGKIIRQSKTNCRMTNFFLLEIE